jgi:hypothetical protein
MPKSTEPLPIRQSDDGKWEVKDAFGNSIKCETKEDAEILANIHVDQDASVLFKYRSMATVEAVEHTIDILKNRRFFCPAPDSFNDPFECRANISFDAPLEVKNERAQKQLMKQNCNITKADAEKYAPTLWKEVEKGGPDRIRSMLYKDAGVVSFSTINDDILMWAHYTGGHNGVCIKFHCTEKNHVDDFFERAYPVQYQKQLPKVNFYTDGPIKKMQAFILTKSEHWNYEQEWRIIVPDAIRKSRYISVPEGVITAIYLGCKITDKNRDVILQNIGAIPAFQAKRKPDAYGLYFEPISDE